MHGKIELYCIKYSVVRSVINSRTRVNQLSTVHKIKSRHLFKVQSSLIPYAVTIFECMYKNVHIVRKVHCVNKRERINKRVTRYRFPDI